MRRLTMEFPVQALGGFGEKILFERVEWMQALHILELNDDSAAMIVRVKFKEPKIKTRDLIRGQEDTIRRLELLQEEKDGTCTYFMIAKAGSTPGQSRSNDPLKAGGYFTTPYEYKEGKARISYVGDAKQVKRLRQLVDKTGAPYKVVSLEDAKFSWKTPLDRLTEKQKRILALAYHLGYFDIPKKTSIKRLARMLQVAPSTLDVELRRGERRLLVDALGEA
jgi:predicted DNA binding protein